MNDKENLREKFLDAAWLLFWKRGYDVTSVQLIIDEVGASKGAFYHHFTSKEALLSEVIDRLIDSSITELQPTVDDPDLGALGKLNLLFDRSWRWKTEHIEPLFEFTRALNRPENRALQQMLYDRSLSASTPLFSAIIAQGVREGAFDVEQPALCATMILEMGHSMRDVNVDDMLTARGDRDKIQAIQHRIDFYLQSIERVLGLSKNSLDRVDEGFINRIALATKRDPAEPPHA